MSEINLIAGDSSVLDFTIYKDEQPLDLKDFLVLFTVKKPFERYTNLHTLDDEKAIIVKNSDVNLEGGIEKYGTGNIKVIIGSQDSKNILDGTYDYDIQISKPGTQDTVITVISGQINFSKEITRRTTPL